MFRYVGGKNSMIYKTKKKKERERERDREKKNKFKKGLKVVALGYGVCPCGSGWVSVP